MGYAYCKKVGTYLDFGMKCTERFQIKRLMANYAKKGARATSRFVSRLHKFFYYVGF